MTTIARVVTNMTGFVGGSGTVTHYCIDPQAFQADVAGFWSVVKNFVPNDVTYAVAGSGDLLDDVTGELTGAWAYTAPGPQTGTQTGTYAAPAGMCINWLTQAILHGRRLRGKTFIVPCAANQYAADGLLDFTAKSTLEGAAQTFIASTTDNFLIWHRPREASEGPPVVTQRDGGSAVVTNAVIGAKVAVLRSRRD